MRKIGKRPSAVAALTYHRPIRRRPSVRIPARRTQTPWSFFAPSRTRDAFLKTARSGRDGRSPFGRRPGAFPGGSRGQPRLDRGLRQRRGARGLRRRAIREAARSLGILPASILPLYQARGRGEISGFTVPAINLRILTYDTARAAVCRAARALDAGAVIFEIARSEIGYTDQRPAEYAAVVLAAAIAEGLGGPASSSRATTTRPIRRR